LAVGAFVEDQRGRPGAPRADGGRRPPHARRPGCAARGRGTEPSGRPARTACSPLAPCAPRERRAPAPLGDEAWARGTTRLPGPHDPAAHGRDHGLPLSRATRPRLLLVRGSHRFGRRLGMIFAGLPPGSHPLRLAAGASPLLVPVNACERSCYTPGWARHGACGASVGADGRRDRTAGITIRVRAAPEAGEPPRRLGARWRRRSASPHPASGCSPAPVRGRRSSRWTALRAMTCKFASERHEQGRCRPCPGCYRPSPCREILVHEEGAGRAPQATPRGARSWTAS